MKRNPADKAHLCKVLVPLGVQRACLKAHVQSLFILTWWLCHNEWTRPGLPSSSCRRKQTKLSSFVQSYFFLFVKSMFFCILAFTTVSPLICFVPFFFLRFSSVAVKMTMARYRPTWELAMDPLVSCKLCLGEFPLEQMTTITQCQCVFCTLVSITFYAQNDDLCKNYTQILF